MNHDDANRLLAAGAVLDDLAPEEQLAYGVHRAGCDECRRLEVELDMVLADLALTAAERRPPADLLAGIRAAIAADGLASGPPAVDRGLAATTGARQPAAEGPARQPVGAPPAQPIVSLDAVRAARASRRPTFAAIGLAAALAIAAAGLGARTASLGSDLDRAQAQVEALSAQVSGQGAAMTAVMDPRHVTASLEPEPLAPSATAMVVYVPGTTRSYLIADNLPPTPAGRTYQLWYADAAGAHPLGTATWSGGGAFVAGFGMDLSSMTAVMVTLEPTGGSTGTPGPQVVFGHLRG